VGGSVNLIAGLIVAHVNDDNLTLPMVLFRDGSALTNPSAAQVGSRLV
jgi:hypothetical protein